MQRGGRGKVIAARWSSEGGGRGEVVTGRRWSLVGGGHREWIIRLAVWGKLEGDGFYFLELGGITPYRPVHANRRYAGFDENQGKQTGFNKPDSLEPDLFSQTRPAVYLPNLVYPRAEPEMISATKLFVNLLGISRW